MEEGTSIVIQAPNIAAAINRGARTANDFAGFMETVMLNVASGDMSPAVGEAIANVGGRMLKAVELNFRYGNRAHAPSLTLTE